MTSSAAEILRAAADRIDTLAVAAMPSPWECLADGDRILSNPDNSDYEFEYVIDEPMSHAGNAHWLTTLSPAVAPALSSWLRGEAEEIVEEQRDQTEYCTDCQGTGQMYDGDPIPFPCTSCRIEVDRPALDFARLVLGDTTTSEGDST